MRPESDQPDPRVVEFEQSLDTELGARLTVRNGGPDSLLLAANIVETAWADARPDLGRRFTHGMHILAPYLIEASRGSEIDVADLVADLDFAAHYHYLRNMLYYTYNAPDTVSWDFDGDHVRIRFSDPTLPRQFYIQHNNWFLDSRDGFASESAQSERIETLLKGNPEFQESSAGVEAMDLIAAEVETKLSLYFDLVSDPSVAAGSYSFGQFRDIYRALLVKALYHRYHARVNDSRGVVSMALGELAQNLATEISGIDQRVARLVVKDISYGRQAQQAGLDPLYFSLLQLPGPTRIVMLPHDFAVWEGFVNFLRLIALRDPKTFLSSFSEQIGSGMVRRLATAVDAAGFSARTNVSLSKYSGELPDIDLLIISEEPTLGYVLFVCEVKASLPARWAKDELRVLQPDSVAKAFDQLSRILAFLDSEQGVEFIRGVIPEEGLRHFDEFAVLVHSLVVTSDNSGAFFSDREATIIDFRTMERLLSRCDGDTQYVLHVLNEIDEWTERGYEVVITDTQIGGRTVQYEGVELTSIVDFAPVTWRSENRAEQMVDETVRRGDRPLDVIRERLHSRTVDPSHSWLTPRGDNEA